MKNKVILILVITAITLLPCQFSFSGNNDSSDFLRSGLLGAGAGAVGGAASGAKGGEVWKGALAGAGVNIIGGALLDSLSGEKTRNVQEVDSAQPRAAYSGGYEDGYRNGYKSGYTEGYREGLRESARGDNQQNYSNYPPNR
ncbi:secreted protein [Candidatus Omnitrophus magneticus]|uniref:Secreted protein n=1 Tax=Candidatus Omnitrophus magneticus TaxID=1609969 RepID=A0A0F0CUK4_9BACT|nr:secreted protein [Candidatus Omnitrophus magneticus]